MSCSTIRYMLGDGHSVQDSALIAQAEAVKSASISLAREDFNEFAERVLKDESTQEPILQQWFHEDWTKKRDQHHKCLFISAVGLGKSQQFSIAFPVWLLGRNPRLRIAIVSKSQNMATQLTDACAKLIEESSEVREIFPELRPGETWNMSDRRVERPFLKDPSLKPIGVNTSITGMRFDVIILDDILDMENSRIESRRDLVEQWINSVLFSRLEPESERGDKPEPRVYFVGNAWHPDDIYERFAKRGWPLFRYPVEVNAKLGKQCPEVLLPKRAGGLGLKPGQTVWPARFSQRALDKLKKHELPAEWQRARMCEARSDEDARFDPSHISWALRKGRDIPVCRTLREFILWDDPYVADDIASDVGQAYLELGSYTNSEANFWAVSGVDLSTGEGTDLTAISTIAICRHTYKRFILSVESGKWKAPEIIARLKDTYSRYGSLIIVENNGTQAYIRQMLGASSAIPCFKYNTGWTKADPSRGIEQIAQELFQGKWCIPSENGRGADPELEELCAELKAYNPRSHTGDRAMSLWFAQILAVRLERQHAKERARQDAWKEREQES